MNYLVQRFSFFLVAIALMEPLQAQTFDGFDARFVLPSTASQSAQILDWAKSETGDIWIASVLSKSGAVQLSSLDSLGNLKSSGAVALSGKIKLAAAFDGSVYALEYANSDRACVLHKYSANVELLYKAATYTTRCSISVNSDLGVEAVTIENIENFQRFAANGSLTFSSFNRGFDGAELAKGPEKTVWVLSSNRENAKFLSRFDARGSAINAFPLSLPEDVYPRLSATADYLPVIFYTNRSRFGVRILDASAGVLEEVNYPGMLDGELEKPIRTVDGTVFAGYNSTLEDRPGFGRIWTTSIVMVGLAGKESRFANRV